MKRKVNTPEWKILLRFNYRNHLDQCEDYVRSFVSIADFENYMRWMPERAMSIGYIPRDEERLKSARATNVRLSICRGEFEIFFDTSDEFRSFIKTVPDRILRS